MGKEFLAKVLKKIFYRSKMKRKKNTHKKQKNWKLQGEQKPII